MCGTIIVGLHLEVHTYTEKTSILRRSHMLTETTDWVLEEVTCPIMTNESIQNELPAKGKSSL